MLQARTGSTRRHHLTVGSLRPRLEIACPCAREGHPGTEDGSTRACPWECWCPGDDASVRLRVADLSDHVDFLDALEEHGITCPTCDGRCGEHDDHGKWVDCGPCDGRGHVLAYDCSADHEPAVEWIRARAQDGDGYAADWLFSRGLLAWQRPTEPAPAGEEAAE